VNQDILNLYQKAQNGGLNAQEVFWLEGQVATFPSFAMGHMILARHHFRNQSTIKNKALLKAAAYACNRSLLRGYLEDALSVPRVRPMPVSEVKPVVEKKAEAPVINLKKESEERPATEIETPEAKQVETSEIEQAQIEISPVENPQVQEAQIETPETERAQIETPEVASAQVETQEDEKAKLVPGPQAGEVNWFLNMRVRLRADKYKILSKRIHASVATYAERLAEAGVAIEATGQPTAEKPAIDTATNPPIAEEQLLAETMVPAMEHKSQEEPFAEKEPPQEESKPATSIESPIAPPLEPAPVEPIMEIVVEQPVAQTNTPLEETPLITPVVLEVSPPVAETPDLKEAKAQEHASQDHPEAKHQEKPITPTAPEKEYEIGAFSSFTFLSEGETGDTEDDEEASETASMDTDIATLEAVEFQTLDGKDGVGEIIFEENDRIIEVIISPEALEKYFKGRLPVTETESSERNAGKEAFVSKGEFQIELDELEYRGQEEAETKVNSPGAKDIRPKAEALIEKFIENEPTITRAKAAQASTGDLAKESSHIDEEWVTETLGRIYEKQGNKAKAIKIYEKLRLRIPEKSDYFGLLIEKLKH
jgi:hypothetical protein